jgi:hypothetical protein
MSQPLQNRRNWTALLLAILAVCGCAQNGGAPTEVTPQTERTTAAATVVLAIGQSADVAPSARLTFDRVVGDSRCPTGVQCAWAGEVEVALTLQAPAGSQSFQLSDRADSSVVLGYTVKLMAVEPHPRANSRIPAADYRATVRVGGS